MKPLTVRQSVGLLFWKFGNKISKLGCWIRGTHIDPKDMPRTNYCQQCGKLKWNWRLPADQ